MPQFFSRLMVEQHGNEFRGESHPWQDSELAAFGYYDNDEGQVLDALALKVRRNPKDLVAHVRRIYFCYEKHLSAQLFASLLDLLIVLQGKGQAISRRMIQACRSQLDSGHLQVLNQVAGHDRFGNHYSLFSTGLVGQRELVEHQRRAETQHDFLALADDFIEYSQLDQAMEVLETGIGLQPDRVDLQQALLELYQSTGSRERFTTFRRRFTDTGVPLVDEWQRMANFFEGQSS